MDIRTPPRLDGGVWTYTDLHLYTLVAAGTGEIQIADEDENAAACDRGHIPGEHREPRRQPVTQPRRPCLPLAPAQVRCHRHPATRPPGRDRGPTTA